MGTTLFRIVIDMGMTGTAAYMRCYHGSGDIDTYTLLNGQPTKAPTRLRYDGDRLLDTSLDSQDQEFDVYNLNGSNTNTIRTAEWFKLYLDERFLMIADRSTVPQPPESVAEAQKWFTDYLRLVYGAIKQYWTGNFHTWWTDAHVSFEFSYPAIWDLATRESFFRCTIRSGFGSGGKDHSARLALSEAEAATRYMNSEVGRFQFSTSLNEGDTVLVCDIGGATADLALLSVTMYDEARSFQLIQEYYARPVGTTRVDAEVSRFIFGLLPNDMDVIARERTVRQIRQSRDWMMFKCQPCEDGTDYEYQPAATIRGEQLTVPSHIIRSIFDRFAAALVSEVVKVVEPLKQRVHHIILCGGGSLMPHVCKSFKEKIAIHASIPHSNLSQTTVNISMQGELAVAKGLLSCNPVQLPYSLGLVCGNEPFRFANLSKIAWYLTDDTESRAGAEVGWIWQQGAWTLTPYKWQFEPRSKWSKLYITIVVKDHSIIGKSVRPICELRRPLLRPVFGNAPTLTFTLTLNAPRSRIDIQAEADEVRKQVYFERRRLHSTTEPLVEIKTAKVVIKNW